MNCSGLQAAAGYIDLIRKPFLLWNVCFVFVRISSLCYPSGLFFLFLLLLVDQTRYFVLCLG